LVKKLRKLISRKLDNTAKVFSIEEKRNINTFRLTVILKEKVNKKILKEAIRRTLRIYPSYKVKIKNGVFWNYLQTNKNDILLKEEKDTCKTINLKENNDYLFKVTYFHNRINLDIFHVLTDGMGGTIFLKGIIYNYFNLKYNLKINIKNILKDTGNNKDEYINNVDRKLVNDIKNKRAYFIEDEQNILKNKTYHYVLDLEKFKNICKLKEVTISEYLTALYILAIYKSIYKKESNRDIVVTVPIDLRKYYNVQSLSNFFTCMTIDGNISKKSRVTFNSILNHVHKEYTKKLKLDSIKKFLSRDVKLGTNIGIEMAPLFIKKIFMKYFAKEVRKNTTTTLSNIGAIKLENKYKKYIENIIALVSTGKVEKVKCTICSFENNLTVTLNTNLISNKLENEFYKLLLKKIGNVKIING